MAAKPQTIPGQDFGFHTQPTSIKMKKKKQHKQTGGSDQSPKNNRNQSNGKWKTYFCTVYRWGIVCQIRCIVRPFGCWPMPMMFAVPYVALIRFRLSNQSSANQTSAHPAQPLTTLRDFGYALCSIPQIWVLSKRDRVCVCRGERVKESSEKTTHQSATSPQTAGCWGGTVKHRNGRLFNWLRTTRDK